MADSALKIRKSLANRFRTDVMIEMLYREAKTMSVEECQAHAYDLAGDSMRAWYPFKHGDACRCACGFEGRFDASPVGSVVIADAVWRDGDSWVCEGCYRG